MYGSSGDEPQINPEVQQWFASVDRDHSGKISDMELKAALAYNLAYPTFEQSSFHIIRGTQLIRALHVSRGAALDSMENYGMFDKEKSGTIDLPEFQALYNYINAWLGVFRGFDHDNSGSIQESELYAALTQMGYRFSPEFIRYLIKKSDFNHTESITVDQFIVLCVQIQRFTDAFRSKDTEQSGTITISFEDFLSIALSCSV